MNRELKQLFAELRINRITMLKALRKEVELKVDFVRRSIEKSTPQVTC